MGVADVIKDWESGMIVKEVEDRSSLSPVKILCILFLGLPSEMSIQTIERKLSYVEDEMTGAEASKVFKEAS